MEESLSSIALPSVERHEGDVAGGVAGDADRAVGVGLEVTQGVGGAASGSGVVDGGGRLRGREGGLGGARLRARAPASRVQRRVMAGFSESCHRKS